MPLEAFVAMRAGFVVALAVVVTGCATPVDVRPLATGRRDASAFELKGADAHTLRLAAQRLCPNGGEIVREAGHSLPPEAEAGRWRSTLNTLAAWAEPPRRAAQLVVVCRDVGDRAVVPATVARQSVVPAVSLAPDVTVALPVGPILPEW